MMSTRWRSLRVSLPALIAAVTWLAVEQSAHAQELIAQTGPAKTGVCYGLFFLAVILGLVAVCRPSSRQWQYTEEELRLQQARKQGQVKKK